MNKIDLDISIPISQGLFPSETKFIKQILKTERRASGPRTKIPHPYPSTRPNTLAEKSSSLRDTEKSTWSLRFHEHLDVTLQQSQNIVNGRFNN